MKFFKKLADNSFQSVYDSKEADWLHYQLPDEVVIQELVNEYSLPEDFITSGLDRYEIPRYEVIENKSGHKIHLLLLLTPIRNQTVEVGKEYITEPLSIIIFPDKVLTVSPHTPKLIDDIANNRPHKSDKNLLHGQAKDNHLVLRILWRLMNDYIEKIAEINIQIEQLESNIHDTTKNEMFDQLISIHKSLVYFHTAINKNHDKILQIKSIDLIETETLNKEFLHDIEVVSSQALVLVDESDEMISHLSEVFSNVISNNMNYIMKFLTALTVVLTIPQLIGSIWGMNVGLPLERHPFGFSILIIATVLITILTIKWLKNKDFF